MTTFTTGRTSTAVIDTDRGRVWDLLVRPEVVARFTPFVQQVRDLGDGRWRWHLGGIPYPGGHFSASFTERMSLDPQERIGFSHEPEDGVAERAGANGSYTLQPHEQGTLLSIAIEISAVLPLPKQASGIVTTAMDVVIARMGDRFSANLLAELGARDVGR